MKTIGEQLARLRSLKENWDSHGSPSLCHEAFRDVERLLSEFDLSGLPDPQAVPISGGGINLEWETETKELELSFYRSGLDGYLKVWLPGYEQMEEGAIDLSRTEDVQALMDWLKEG